MDLKLDLTVLLPTFNSEKTIKKTLDSISWAKEIIIIDSFSNDSTLNIAMITMIIALFLFVLIILHLRFSNIFLSSI